MAVITVIMLVNISIIYILEYNTDVKYVPMLKRFKRWIRLVKLCFEVCLDKSMSSSKMRDNTSL